MSDQTFDYIVIGTGAAGGVMADYLSRDGTSSVLVLESGGPAWHPFFRMPKGFFFLLNGSKFGQKNAFTYMSTPTGPQQRSEPWLRGRVDGGSASYNGSQYERASDYYWNGLEQSGLDGWGWESMVQVFKGYEDNEFGASETRGAGGPLRITITRQRDELDEAFIASGVANGIPWVEDVNEVSTERFGFVPTTIKNGLRHSAAHAFLAPARKRRNVTHLRHAHVAKVLFSGTRATGVSVKVGDSMREFHARREVVICAGSLETPQLLERSGIGSEEVLRSIGVTPVMVNPNVGEHLNEQRMISYQARINKKIGDTHELRSIPARMWSGMKYLATRKGPIAQGGYDIGAFLKLMPDSEQTDSFLLMNPLALDVTGPGMDMAPHPGFSAIAYPLHSVTESSIHASGSTPDAPPVLDARFMETTWEQEINLRMLNALREIAAQHPLADLIVEEEQPGPKVTTVEQALQHAWDTAALAHSVGSARMGTSIEDSVVDARLRVHGVEGLRIADTSVLPQQPGNTMAPAIAVGAKGATMMIQDR